MFLSRYTFIENFMLLITFDIMVMYNLNNFRLRMVNFWTCGFCPDYPPLVSYNTSPVVLSSYFTFFFFDTEMRGAYRFVPFEIRNLFLMVIPNLYPLWSLFLDFYLAEPYNGIVSCVCVCVSVNLGGTKCSHYAWNSFRSVSTCA